MTRFNKYQRAALALVIAPALGPFFTGLPFYLYLLPDVFADIFEHKENALQEVYESLGIFVFFYGYGVIPCIIFGLFVFIRIVREWETGYTEIVFLHAISFILFLLVIHIYGGGRDGSILWIFVPPYLVSVLVVCVLFFIFREMIFIGRVHDRP